MKKTKAEQLYELGCDLVANGKEIPENFSALFKGTSSDQELVECINKFHEGSVVGLQILEDRKNRALGLPTAQQLNDEWDRRDRENIPPDELER